MVGIDPLPEGLQEKFDLITILGALIPFHLPPTIFETLLDVTKKDGFCMFAVRKSLWEGSGKEKVPYKEAMDALVEAQKYKFIYLKEVSMGSNEEENIASRENLLSE
mmetsp:Transcript_5373/g.4064  ORF Transcript_5373/g.4064 Transcript_5373/m.4064 type:complete len:107 (-) Transcript_5373:80-400(-)